MMGYASRPTSSKNADAVVLDRILNILDQPEMKSYFIEEEPGLSKSTKQFLHTENLVLIDEDGHIRGLYNGTLEAEVPRISEDIRVLLEAL